MNLVQIFRPTPSSPEREVAKRRPARARRCILETLEPRQMLDAGPVISEFMAVNNATLADEDGNFSDWIEIHNPTSTTINLDGWYLTDNAAELTKWRFPARSLQPNEYLLAFASDKDRAAAQGQLHTNFKLSGSGEYLALVEPDGVTVAHAYAPEYPDQTADVSYGLAPVSPVVLVPEQTEVAFHLPTAGDAALGTQWTERDFNATAWSGFANLPTVLITEVATGALDYVEIQNVTSKTVDTSGWVVVANDPATDYRIDRVYPTSWELPAWIVPGEVLYRHNDPDADIDPGLFWGGQPPLDWRALGVGWVLLMDGAGNVVDFVAWGHDDDALEIFPSQINNHDVSFDDFWTGSSVTADGSRTNSLQRQGTADHDRASDWEFVTEQSKGTPNEDLEIAIPTTLTTGIGFSMDPTAFGDVVQTDVSTEMYGKNASLWTRVEFDVPDVSELRGLSLELRYNDGFVAYLNGQRVAWENAPELPEWNASAPADRSVAESLDYQPFDLTAHLGELRAGRNVLAIHGLNVDAADDDFLIQPRLLAVDRAGIEQSFLLATPGGTNRPGGVVINEIHLNPDVKTEPVEFIELHNWSSQSVDLSGWSFTNGVLFTFPQGTTLASGAYVVVSQDPAALQNKYGVSSLGPYVGQLANNGEKLVLRDAGDDVRDEVDYGLGFPWPTVGDAPGYSIELIHPVLDNDLGGSWRASDGAGGAAGPTPGAANSVYATAAPPQMRQVKHTPAQPTSGQHVTITVKATDPDGVASVSLAYQLVDPGNYIRLEDAAYQTTWTTVAMRDDGAGGDAAAGDDVYTVVLPGALQTHRRLVRYRITAVDATGASITGPYADDPQPNFAYFVYDGVPAWTGADRPGVTQPKTFDTGVMNQLPIYHLIADAGDVEKCQYNGSYENTRFNGTMVYDGEVYDHVEFRIRGEVSTYYSGKNKWRFYSNRGHDFQVRDPYGEPYAEKYRIMNLGPASTPWMPCHRGMAGIGEAIAFRLYQLAGVPSPNMSPLQFRVIDDAQESNPSDQYDGDLWGLYWTVEHADGRFLDERNLPDGNVYKMEGGGDKKNQGPTDSPTNADVNALLSAYRQYQSIDWWRANINLRDYYSFRAVNREVNNMDIREAWNVFYYHNPDTDQWSPVPWDLDMLYGPTTNWSGVTDMQNSILQHPELMREYQARGRELQDLLFNEDQLGQLVDEYAAMVNPPGEARTMVDVDQFMWNYNPRSRTDGWGVHQGAFYTNPGDVKPGPAVVNRWLTTLDHEGMAQWIKDFMLPAPGGGSVPPAYGFEFLQGEVADSAIPDTPTITYLGDPSFPINDLTLRTSPFSDPQGAGTFAALQWRIGEVTDPAAPAYDPAAPIKYEVTPVWQSGEITTSTEREITLPPLAMEVGHAYRARVRMKDNTGRWSHWSEPIQFVATDPNATALSDSLRITEIMYHPAEPTAEEVAAGFTDKDLFEFVELRNIGVVPLELTNVVLTDGVHFAFGAGNVPTLQPGQYAVVVKDSDAFTYRYGTGISVAGEYDVETEQLANEGERITLVDARAGVLSDFEYNNASGWSGRADGKGASLELIDPDDVPAAGPQRSEYLADPDHWQSSIAYLGTPGENSQPRQGIVINEVLSHTDWPQVDAIELHNVGDGTVVLDDWLLSDSWGWEPLVAGNGNDNYKKFRIPDGTTLAPGAYVTFDEHDFNPTPLSPAPHHFALDGAEGDDIWLMRADAAGNLTHFGDHVTFGAQANGESWGRWPDGREPSPEARGAFYPMTTLTLGEANSGPRPGAVVISEVHYNPGTMPEADDLEFVEIYNASAAAVDLTNWRLRKGVDFDFAAGELLAPGATMVIVSFDPILEPAKLTAFQTAHNLQGPIEIRGPFSESMKLHDDGESVQLQSPDEPPPDKPGFFPGLLADEVIYNDDGPWPVAADGGGVSLHRHSIGAWGNDAASWIAAATTPGHASFDAAVLGRHVFYNGSTFDWDLSADTDGDGRFSPGEDGPNDDAAVATDKLPLLPGGVAGFANYTSYSCGINGVMIDLANLPAGKEPAATDFRFHVGNDDTPGNWPAAADPETVTFRPGAGTGGSDRVTIVWSDDQIRNTWLQVTVKADSLGLAEDDVFFFGNAVAEAGNSTTDAKVTTTDLLLARNNPRDSIVNPADIIFPYDFDRDGQVNATDVLLARNNQTSFLNCLKLIDLTGGAKEAQEPPLAELAWLSEFDQAAAQRPTQKDDAAEAVDKLLAVCLM